MQIFCVSVFALFLGWTFLDSLWDRSLLSAQRRYDAIFRVGGCHIPHLHWNPRQSTTNHEYHFGWISELSRIVIGEAWWSSNHQLFSRTNLPALSVDHLSLLARKLLSLGGIYWKQFPVLCVLRKLHNPICLLLCGGCDSFDCCGLSIHLTKIHLDQEIERSSSFLLFWSFSNNPYSTLGISWICPEASWVSGCPQRRQPRARGS